MKTILIIEDDTALQQVLSDALTEERFSVLSATDGEKGFRMAESESISLIVLDLILPGKNGKDICRDLRSKGVQTPILMLTNKKRETDKVLGLEIGADDYMTKPFSLREFIARIKALLRRQSGIQSAVREVRFGDVHADFERQEATKGEKKLKLSAKEFQLLKFFVEREGKVISRSMLLDEVWGYDAMPTTRTVDNYILSLRKKIEPSPSRPIHLLTVHTAGYKFVK
ncbi:MAG TPA: response regulator transcription factor [Bacteroidota bacterium]|nr:response regulator transcription factor [Bacteroidota bacterium]